MGKLGGKNAVLLMNDDLIIEKGQSVDSRKWAEIDWDHYEPDWLGNSFPNLNYNL